MRYSIIDIVHWIPYVWPSMHESEISLGTSDFPIIRRKEKCIASPKSSFLRVSLFILDSHTISFLICYLSSMKTIHLYNYRYIVQETHTFRDAKAFDTSLQLNATPQIKTIMRSFGCIQDNGNFLSPLKAVKGLRHTLKMWQECWWFWIHKTKFSLILKQQFFTKM